MDYKSELKGFCFDRALHYHEKLDKDAKLADVMATADALVSYFYMADKDWQSAGTYLIELAEEASLDGLNELVFNLQNIADRRAAHAARLAEKVQSSLKTETAQ